MGIFDKIKSAFKGATEESEEKKKAREEAERFDPVGKNLEWFASDDGLQALAEYTEPKGYILQETMKKEKEEHSDCSLDIIAEVYHKGSKIPYKYFKWLINNIESEALKYVGPTELVIDALSLQAKTFYLDDDGEPQKRDMVLTPEDLVSVERNPVLNYVSNFNCFSLKDDADGSWEDKWAIYREVIFFLEIAATIDKNVIANNQWLFAKDSYFNDLGTVRKLKGFLKKACELSNAKPYFEKRLTELE